MKNDGSWSAKVTTEVHFTPVQPAKRGRRKAKDQGEEKHTMDEEYITRKSAREAVEKGVIYSAMDRHDTLQNIRLIPAANVRPVIYGHWEEVAVEDTGNMLVASMRCDQCNRYHNEVYHYGEPTEMAHFCSFCGADMRKPKTPNEVDSEDKDGPSADGEELFIPF